MFNVPKYVSPSITAVPPIGVKRNTDVTRWFSPNGIVTLSATAYEKYPNGPAEEIHLPKLWNALKNGGQTIGINNPTILITIKLTIGTNLGPL